MIYHVVESKTGVDEICAFMCGLSLSRVETTVRYILLHFTAHFRIEKVLEESLFIYFFYFSEFIIIDILSLLVLVIDNILSSKVK